MEFDGKLGRRQSSQSPSQNVDIPVTFAGTVNVDIAPSIGSLSIDNSGTTLDILGYYSLTVSDGLVNNGTIVVNSDNVDYYTYLTFSGSQTLSGTGSLILNNSAFAELNTSNSGLLTQAAGHTISGSRYDQRSLINQGLVNANVNGQTLTLATNAMTNAGTMEATNGGELTVQNTVNNTGGTISASGSGTLWISGGGTVNNAGGTDLGVRQRKRRDWQHVRRRRGC